MSTAVVLADLRAVELRTSEQPVYDRPFELSLLYSDHVGGAEHYVIRYRAGTKAKLHRRTAAHTIVVLEGHLMVDGVRLGPGGYAHHPGGTAVLHEPADDGSCLFVPMFHGSFDVEALDTSQGRATRIDPT